MTAITEANAKKLIKAMPFFRQQSRDGLDGWWKWLENFDDTTGAITVTVDDTIAGTEAALFTVGIASGTTPRISLASPSDSGKTGDFILSVTPGTLAANRSVYFPDSLGADDVIVTQAMTQTLVAKTLTSPTIADFTNATHDHADAAGGGTISTTVSGTTSSTFTVNQGAVTETEIAITSADTTGGFTATLAIPTLGADRTITFPAVTCTLASVTGTETLTNKTLTSPSMTLPTIADGLLASGSVANDFSSSTGDFLTSSGDVTLSGDVTIAAGKDLTMSSTATFTTGTGAIALNGAVTMATTKGVTFGSAAAGTATPLTMYSLTANLGALIIAVADSSTDHATTLTNAALNGSAATITLPNATTVLSGLALDETVTGDKVHTGTLDIRGNVSVGGTANPNFDLSGSTGTFLSPSGANTLSGNVTIAAEKTITLTGNTSGSLVLSAADVGTNATTIVNSGGGSAKIITLPAATGTLAILGANTFTGTQTIMAVTSAVGDYDMDFSLSTGEFKTSSGANQLTGDVTVAAGKNLTLAKGAGIITANGATSGGIVISPISVGTNATTIQNSAGGSAKTITLPTATATLSGIGLAETFSAVKTFTAAPVVSITDAATNSVVDVMTIGLIGGTPAAGLGLGLSFIVENSVDSTTQCASLDVVNTTVTKASMDTDLLFSTMLAGSVTEALRIDASDQSLTIGAATADSNSMDKLRIYGLTSTKGSLVIQSVANDGDTDLTIVNEAQAQATTLTIPDCENATANVVLTYGAVTMNGAMTLTGGVVGGIDAATGTALTYGAATATSVAIGASDITTTLKGIVKGDAEGYMTHTLVVDATAAEINAGHVLVTCPAGRQLQLVDVVAVAYGGAVGACDTVDIIEETSSTKFVTFAQGDLTQSSTLTMAVNGTDIADGASYAAMTADKDILVSKTGSDVTTATGVRFIISYIIV